MADISARSRVCRECRGRCTDFDVLVLKRTRQTMPQIDPVIGWMAIGAAAAIFAASGGLKFYDLESFRGAVANYRLLPEWLATPFAWTAPVIESAAALGLLLAPVRA